MKNSKTLMFFLQKNHGDTGAHGCFGIREAIPAGFS